MTSRDKAMDPKAHEILWEAKTRNWGSVSSQSREGHRGLLHLDCKPDALVEVCKSLFIRHGLNFAGLVAEESDGLQLRYIFYSESGGWVDVVTQLSGPEDEIPSISEFVHAADWHERETEDLFGVTFKGHPRLGNFILHDDVWKEPLAPLRKKFDLRDAKLAKLKTGQIWKPRQIVEEEGAFMMPVGPVYSVAAQPAHFVLETVGEDVIRAQPRLFYTFRGLEKLAEQRTVYEALLIAERISGTSAFAHSLAFALAVESLSGIEAPPRACALRMFFAELERLRHHVAAIEGICESTSFSVASAQLGILQEDLLRLSCILTNHRYLFGVNTVGGVIINPTDDALRLAAAKVCETVGKLARLEEMLSRSSSFLDRLEEVGKVSMHEARDFGMVGPVARASATSYDLRKSHPYCGYSALCFDVPYENEGDGYARLRVFFREAFQSARVLKQLADSPPSGSHRVDAPPLPAGAALGWVEAPAGAAFHWVRIGKSGRVERYRIITPSFANWHGFRLAAENFAFQDFPIILATFALSVHENDR